MTGEESASPRRWGGFCISVPEKTNGILDNPGLHPCVGSCPAADMHLEFFDGCWSLLDAGL
jgi:hypothetical protein